MGYINNNQKGDIMAAYFYILANETNEVLYKGSTTDLIRRTYEHKEHLYEGSFTDIYNITRLIYYECYDDIQSARARERQVGKWSRKNKDKIISKMNPKWIDLYWGLLGQELDFEATLIP